MTGPPDAPEYFTVYKVLSEWSFHTSAVDTPVLPKQLACGNQPGRWHGRGRPGLLVRGVGQRAGKPSPSRNSAALRFLCRLTGAETKPGFSLHSTQRVAHAYTTERAREFLCQLRIRVSLWLEHSILFIHINPLLLLSLIIFTLKWRGGLCEHLGAGPQPPLAIFVHL